MLSRRTLLSTAAAAIPLRGAGQRDQIRERASALATFPGQRIGPAEIERANQIAEGTVFFYSRTPVKVGLESIDWSGGHVHHQEWPAQLNRFFHLAPLAAAYAATRDERYARAARAYLHDWMRSDPYPNASAFRSGDNALTMSIRIGTSVSPGWSANLPAFLPSPAFDDAFLDRLCGSLSRQAEFLSHHLTAVGNWRISELDALVFLSLRLPFLANAATLRDTGIAGMREALANQFLDDGVHIERTPGYHDWMTQVAVNYFDLARRFPEADAKVDATRAVRSLDYGAQSELFGVNDSTAPHRDPTEFSHLATRKESLATMGLAARVPADPPLDQVFSNAGQVFSRTAWKPGADYLAFDASTWGGGHGHLSRLSFVFRGGGRMIVADPGIFTYEMSDPAGPYGKSTLAHSTLCVDGWNQSSADAQLLRTEFTPATTTVHARYQGGWWKGRYAWAFNEGHGEGVWGEHERTLLWVKGEYVVVIDSITTEAGRTIHNCFQMGPMEQWSHDAAALRFTGLGYQVVLAVAPTGAQMQCFEGQKEPLRGWVGHHSNDTVAAPQIEFRYPSSRNRPVTTVTVVAPSACTVKSGDAAAGHLDIVKPNGKTDRIHWTRGELPRRETL